MEIIIIAASIDISIDKMYCFFWMWI